MQSITINKKSVKLESSNGLEINSTRFFNIPNVLSFLRILLIPSILFFIYNSQKVFSLIIFTVAIITDYIDGYFARKLNIKNKYGLYVDVSADFLLIISIWSIFTIINSISPFIIILTSLYFLQFIISVSFGKLGYDPIGKYYGTWHMCILALGIPLNSELFLKISVNLTIGFTILAFLSRYRIIFKKNKNI